MRRARIRTRHGSPDLVAAALVPDNTDEMSTAVEGDTVVTTIERDATGGLATTADDYLVNLQVAESITNDTTDDTHNP